MVLKQEQSPTLSKLLLFKKKKKKNPNTLPSSPQILGALNECNPIPSIVTNSPSITDHIFFEIVDRDMSAALQKGKGISTQHPISSYVSCNNMSYNFSIFRMSLSQFLSPKHIKKLLRILAIEERMRALCDCGTIKLRKLPVGKDVVGCMGICFKLSSRWLY